MTMDGGYDELLDENPFFQALNAKGKTLYEAAALNRWMVCIPRKGSTGRSNYNTDQFETHILKPIVENKYETANGKEVEINGSFIVTSKGFTHVQSVKILFEETYFNPKEESYHVLCIDHPLDGSALPVLESVVPNLETLKNCSDFLWSGATSRRGRRQIDEIVSLFNSNYQRLETQSIRHAMDAANAVFTRALQSALKEPHLGRPSRGSKAFHDNVKVAVETYVMHGLHKRIFNGLSSFLASKDAALNKVTRNLADLQVKDLGVRLELCKNIPKAKRILSKLNEFTTPLEKLYVLKFTITAVSECMNFGKEVDNSASAVTADDLLVVLVFLVVKSEIPNWLANLTYMHNFHFSKCKSDEFQFYLASAEAAVEYVRSGKLDSVVRSSRATGQTIKSGFFENLGSNEKQSSPSLLDRLFKYIIDGDEENMLKILSHTASKGKELAELLCHPLCSCDKCEKLLLSKKTDPSSVTVFSRDDTGATVLHVAAEFGREGLTHTLIKQGAVVNATNYHGDSPLHFACSKGHKSAALVLIYYGADVNAADNDGNTPLHTAVANGHEEVTEALIYAHPENIIRVNLNMANENGDTPLHIASRWGFSAIVKLLLESGASINLKNHVKQIPRQCALNSKVQEILDQASRDDRDNAAHPPKQEMLTPHFEEPLDLSKPGNTKRRKAEFERLIKAVVDGDFELVRHKLGIAPENKEDVIKDPDIPVEKLLCHPLCQCDKCANLQKDPVSESVTLNANMTTRDGATPLHFAALHGFERIVSLLLNKAAADPNVKTKSNERTPLHLACQYNHIACVSLLIKHGAKVSTKDHSGNTALHFCCTNGHLGPAISLLQNEANPNATNRRGNTPLHDAARWNHVDLVNLLLCYGASPSVRNKSLLTPLQSARSDDMITLLSKAESSTEKIEEKQSSEQSDQARHDWPMKGSSEPLFPVESNQDDEVFSPSFPHSLVDRMIPGSEDFSSQVSLRSGHSSVEVDGRNVAALSRETSISSEDDLQSSQPADGYGAHHPSRELRRKTTIHELFEAFEAADLEKLRQIANSIRTFDRKTSLRKVDTVDKSQPFIDDHLTQMLHIQHFDRSSLRHIERQDASIGDQE